MNRAFRAVLFGLAAVATIPALAATADPNRCSVDSPSFCLNGVSGTVTSLDAMRVRLARPEQAQHEEEKRERKASLRPTRLAADGAVSGVGAPGSGWAVWASANRARFEGLVPIAPYEADLDTLSIGVDRLIAGRFLLGAVLAHEQLDTRTRYNAGGQDASGDTLTIYGSYLVNDTVSIDLTAGKGRVDTDQHRLDPGSAPGTPQFLRSSYDADRTLWSITLNASRQLGAFGAGGRIGYLSARERQDGYTEINSGGPTAPRTVTERNVRLQQVFVGLDASYGFSRRAQLHGAVLYRRDSSRDDGRSGGGLPGDVGVVQPADRDEVEWVAGLRIFPRRGITLNIEYLHTSGRDQFKNRSLTLLGRFDF
jgi:hypothetical protein